MNDTIQQLLEALALSPENVPLRMHVAGLLVQARSYEEAAAQYQQVLVHHYGHEGAQLGLADCYFQLKKYSAALIIYEGLHDRLALPDAVRYIKCLLKEGAIQPALDLYQDIQAHHPGFEDPEIDSQLRLPAGPDYPEDDELDLEADSAYFMQKPSEKFADVGGMKRVKEEISMKIIQPLKNPELYKAFGKKTGGGILLYGPPGCGKTFIARATAGEIDAKFMAIGLHDILDMWIGNSEKNLHQVFETARRNAPCVLFIDEVDAMGASRSDMKGSAMRHVINQFLAELDGVEHSNEGVLILAATNAPWSVDSAFRRPGRFDRIIFVEPPDAEARKEILESILKNKPVGELDLAKVAAACEGYSGADLNALVDIASEDKLRESMEKGAIQAITTKDLLKAARQHRATTSEWFASARNYALYANESGLYDDILRYLKIKK
ncbi:MAG TPA: ATP-binding protein [Chitinophagaceae bacterium]|jgi:SpoVK/Ycf46/Vps4 family AAA+-type ATPase|nr:ATP-binding protein [Chitinophagaceae bacterium]